MAEVRISDELQQLVESKVRDGRAESASAYVEVAVRLLLEDDESDDEAIDQDEFDRIVAAGIADLEAGRYITIATKEDEQRLHQSLMARLDERLKSGN